MKIVEISELALADARRLRFGRFHDQRGYFTETFRRSDFEKIDFLSDVDFRQANEAYSNTGVLRGLHLQWNPLMGKLVRTIRGRILDLVVDIRHGSPNQGRGVAVELAADPEMAATDWIWVPPGFVHGTLSTEPTTIEYLCTGEYNPACEAAVSPLAPDIDWSLTDSVLLEELRRLAPRAELSAKDREGLTMAQWRDDPRSRNFPYRGS